MTEKYELKLKIMIFLILFFGAFGLVKSTWAGDGSKIYWVSPTGTAPWPNCQSSTDPGAGKYCGLDGANSYASAGETIYFKGGIYSITGMYAEGLSPKNSGTDRTNRIIFTAAPGENPELVYSSGTRSWGLTVEGNSWLKMDGIMFTNFTDWALIRNRAHAIEVTNCTFRGLTGSEGGGFEMVEACLGGNDFTCYVYDIWVHGNTFSKGGAPSSGNRCVEGGDLVRVGYPYYTCGTDANNNRIPATCTQGLNHHITIENNLIEYAGHAGMDTYGQNLVIRNNVFHNEPWIPDYSGGTCTWPPTYINPAFNGKYGHRNWQMSDDMGRDGTWNLAEGNRSGHASVNPNNDGADNFDLASSKNIIRYNYFYNAMNNGLMPKYGPTGNGSVGELYNRIYNNTIYHNGYGYPYYHTCILSTCPEPQAGIHYYYPGLDIGNVIKNNIVYDNASYGYAGWDIQDSTANTVTNNWLTSNGDPKFVNPDLTEPTSRTLPDLTLQSSSPAKDGGTYLTTAKGSASNSTTLVVDDALYFQDGSWGSDLARGVTLFPDWIAIGTVSNTVQIAQGGINYSTNTLTLASPITWSNGANIWLYKKSDGKQVLYGPAPDYGAFEYGQNGDTIPPAAPTGLMVN